MTICYRVQPAHLLMPIRSRGYYTHNEDDPSDDLGHEPVDGRRELSAAMVMPEISANVE